MKDKKEEVLFYGETNEEIAERTKGVPNISIKVEFPYECKYRYDEKIAFLNSFFDLMQAKKKECSFNIETNITSIRREELKPKGSKSPL